MYGINDLKTVLQLGDDHVICPISDCEHQVQRCRRGDDLKDDRFLCSEHGIYISPSTWEYTAEKDNVLWDVDRLEAHYGSKRESRIARDNSEDAITWNVFRFLERNDMLSSWLAKVAESDQSEPITYFWSHDLNAEAPWDELIKARVEFGEGKSNGSEPDLIILTKQTLFFIEAKFGSGNKAPPRRKGNPKKYETGGNEWFRKVFIGDASHKAVAEEAGLYELMRHWLLGTWMADRLGVDFMLVNLVRSASETKIEDTFGSWIDDGIDRKFQRLTWEEIRDFVESQPGSCPDLKQFEAYMNQKTLGYRNGKLTKAFE